MSRHPTIILIHGILSSEHALRPLRKFFERHGYTTLAVSYPSRQLSIEGSAEHVYQHLRRSLRNEEPFHIVGHSLGGIILRVIARSHPEFVQPRRLQRAVMLGTPNQGSAAAAILNKNRLGRYILGPSGAQLIPYADFLIRSLGRPQFTVGILAGNRSINPLSRLMFDGKPNDGAVAVDATKLAGMSDWIELPTHHSGLYTHVEAQRQILFFLTHGRFDHPLTPDRIYQAS
jgi:pimeloyl-ACP methyl ester carboxylesterase